MNFSNKLVKKLKKWESLSKTDKVFCEIINKLYIGSWKAAVRRGSLSKRNITHILNLT